MLLLDLLPTSAFQNQNHPGVHRRDLTSTNLTLTCSPGFA
jgi:hypothetical protein